MLKWLKGSRWVGISLGAWLIALPWIFDFSAHQAATLNALVMGGVLMVEELIEGHGHEALDYWIDHATGVWLMASPLILGYPGLLPASMSMLIAGVITLALREQEHGWEEGHIPRH